MKNLGPRPGNILFDAETIQQRVRELGRQVSATYRDEELVLVGVLKGSVFVLADLARHITTPTSYELVTISTYGDSRTPQREPELLYATNLNLKGCHVLLVEDIVDTGRTLEFLTRTLLAESPASLRVLTLLSKPARREVEVALDFVGFEISDHFVVGYGLDDAQRHRNLPYIAVL